MVVKDILDFLLHVVYIFLSQIIIGLGIVAEWLRRCTRICWEMHWDFPRRFESCRCRHFCPHHFFMKRKEVRAPQDYELVRPTLEKLRGKLKDAQKTSLKAESKYSSLWPILQASRQISRYVYLMYYERQMILKELYGFLLQEKDVDANLIAKWKKKGYEKLCCVQCIVKPDPTVSTCICRVPVKDAGDKNFDRCVNCGCSGCSSERRE